MSLTPWGDGYVWTDLNRLIRPKGDFAHIALCERKKADGELDVHVYTPSWVGREGLLVKHARIGAEREETRVRAGVRNELVELLLRLVVGSKCTFENGVYRDEVAAYGQDDHGEREAEQLDDDVPAVDIGRK